jgi:hypothetical protein
MRLDQVKDRCCCTDAVNGEDLAAGVSASLENMAEDALLGIKGLVETRTRIKPDLSHITSFGQVTLPKRKFALALADELGMEAKCGADVAAVTG